MKGMKPLTALFLAVLVAAFLTTLAAPVAAGSFTTIESAGRTVVTDEENMKFSKEDFTIPLTSDAPLGVVVRVVVVRGHQPVNSQRVKIVKGEIFRATGASELMVAEVPTASGKFKDAVADFSSSVDTPLEASDLIVLKLRFPRRGKGAGSYFITEISVAAITRHEIKILKVDPPAAGTHSINFKVTVQGTTYCDLPGGCLVVPKFFNRDGELIFTGGTGSTVPFGQGSFTDTVDPPAEGGDTYGIRALLGRRGDTSENIFPLATDDVVRLDRWPAR